MSGGTNIPIPAWMDALGWIIPGKAYDALRTKWRSKERSRINAQYRKVHGIDEYGIPTVANPPDDR